MQSPSLSHDETKSNNASVCLCFPIPVQFMRNPAPWQEERMLDAMNITLHDEAQQRISKAWRDNRGNDALHRLALSRFYNEEALPRDMW